MKYEKNDKYDDLSERRRNNNNISVLDKHLQPKNQIIYENGLQNNNNSKYFSERLVSAFNSSDNPTQIRMQKGLDGSVYFSSAKKVSDLKATISA